MGDTGFAAATLNDIAGRLGTDRASLYYYVANKGELLQKVVRGVITEDVASAENVPARSGSGAQKLGALIEDMMLVPPRFPAQPEEGRRDADRDLPRRLPHRRVTRPGPRHARDTHRDQRGVLIVEADMRRTTAAVAITCAMTLGTIGYAGADPPDGIHPIDVSDAAVTEDGADTGTDGDGGTAPESGSVSASEGIDLDNPVTEQQLRYVTDYLVFKASMRDFQHIRRQRLLSDQVSWSTDACDTALRDPVDGFQEACERREFGYRNFARQDRFDSGMRDRVDKRFKRELREQCDGKDVVARTVCERQADLYFGAVGTI